VAINPIQPDPIVSMLRYRDRADECRRIAHNHPYREGFMRLAALWDTLADNMEAVARSEAETAGGKAIPRRSEDALRWVPQRRSAA
jgi:hypothetical protein